MEILEIIENLNWAIIAPIIVLQVILSLIALVDCLRHKNTNGPLWMWVLIILFVNLIGPIIYFIAGRKND